MRTLLIETSNQAHLNSIRVHLDGYESRFDCVDDPFGAPVDQLRTPRSAFSNQLDVLLILCHCPTDFRTTVFPVNKAASIGDRAF